MTVWFQVASVLSLSGKTLVAGTPGNPYQSIPGRNVFHLNPAQTRPPEPAHPPPARAKVVGIITLLPVKLALLKVYVPARGPEPARETACVLKVGQRDGPIEVLDIDAAAGSVKINNSGSIMVLALVNEDRQPQGPPPRPNPPPLPPPPVPRF